MESCRRVCRESVADEKVIDRDSIFCDTYDLTENKLFSMVCATFGSLYSVPDIGLGSALPIPLAGQTGLLVVQLSVMAPIIRWICVVSLTASHVQVSRPDMDWWKTSYSFGTFPLTQLGANNQMALCRLSASHTRVSRPDMDL